MTHNKIFIFYIILLCFALSATNGIAQSSYTVEGVVYVKGERVPVEGAAVFVEEYPNMPPAITDAKGRFEINLPEASEYNLIAVMIGYAKPAPTVVALEPSTPKVAVSIYLTPEGKLNEIVVNADRNPNRAGKVVISGEELYDIPGAYGDPLKAIFALPGIATGGGGGGGSGYPAIRGSSTEDNIFYIDFMPVGYIFHFGGIYSVVHHDLVDDFNLYLSSVPAEFESRIGGVIDINLREPRTDRWGAKASLSLYTADILVEGPVTENQSFLFTARRSYFDYLYDILMDNLDEETKEEMFNGVSFSQFPRFSDYTGKYVWDVNAQNRLSVIALGASDETSFFVEEENENIANDPVFAGDYLFATSFDTQGVTLDSAIGQNMKNTFGVNHRVLGVEFVLGGFGNVMMDNEAGQIRERLAIEAGPHNLLFGIDYEQYKVDITMAGQFDTASEFDPDFDISGAEYRELVETYEGETVVFYAQDRWKVTDKITLVPGTQYFNGLDEKRSALMPRAAVEYDVDKTLLLTFAWGQYVQYPQGLEFVDVWGNPDLDLLRSEHYTVGVDKKFDSRWRVKAEAYYKTFDDLPVPHDTLNYVSEGSGKAWGAELLLKKQANGSPTSGWLSVAYAETERTNDLTGETIWPSFDHPWIVNLVAKYETDFKWTFSARWRYQSGSPYTPVTGSYVTDDDRRRPIYAEANSERLPAYHQLDLRADRDYLYNNWKLGIFVELLNAYNQENVTGYDYNEEYTEKTPVTGLPIFPSIGFKAEF